MADKENCMRVTRAAKKRAAEAMMESTPQPQPAPPANKKRAVLADISSIVLGNANVGSGSEPQKQNKVRGKKSKKAVSSKPSVVEKTPARAAFESVPAEKLKDIYASSDDPQMCEAYVNDIYSYLHEMEMEVKRKPLPDYIEKIQKDVSANMRMILVDWLVEVAEEYKLLSDTLFLAITYIDRYLSIIPIGRQRLQLLGVSSMLIASKYEEISPPHVGEYVYITDNTYSKKEVVKMEADVLKALNFEMGGPTLKPFLRRFTRVAQENPKKPCLQLEFLGYYLAELSLLDYGCVKMLPSLVAAAVIFLTKFTISPNKHPWDSTLQLYSGYQASDLKKCVQIIHALQLSKKGGNLVAIRDKYKQHKFKCVSTLSSPAEIPPSYFEDVENCTEKCKLELQHYTLKMFDK